MATYGEILLALDNGVLAALDTGEVGPLCEDKGMVERIVVGVDGSASAAAALRWAVDEAGRHDATVVAVLAWSYLDQRQEGEPFDPSYGEDEARDQLRTSIESIGPRLSIDQHVVCDLPAPALLEAGSDADLLVVGARGLGGFKGLLLGSVSERVLEHAPCPVAVVRVDEPQRPDRPVVVGVDGSDASIEALRWAARAAVVRGAPLHVVHAWQIPLMGVPMEQGNRTVERAARTVLDTALADPSLAGLEVEGHLRCLGAVQAVLEDAAAASLIVVGSRGLGRFGRILLGSTSRQLALHAPCPFVVILPT